MDGVTDQNHDVADGEEELATIFCHVKQIYRGKNHREIIVTDLRDLPVLVPSHHMFQLLFERA